jgi:AraC-like DNA-binding protein
LTRVHFDDDCCLRARHWAAFAVVQMTGYVGWLARRDPGVAARLGPHAGAWELAYQALSMALVAHALLNVWLGSRADLVMARLRRRYWILGLTGGYVLVERTALALAEGTASEATVDGIYAVSLALLVFGILLMATLVQPGVLRPSDPAPAPEPAVDPRLVEQLRRLVEVEHVYREEGLTITALAARLGAHEYKVRQLVNAQLGFKNFNAFLHHYRLGEAQRLLADPARRHLTVAQVAFEVGYRSLGPFNRAFKEATGVTPTEFRASRGDAERPVTPAAGQPVAPRERPATS